MSVVDSFPKDSHDSGSCIDCSRRGLRLFCNLGDEALKQLDAIAEPVKLPAHAIVYTEQDVASAVFVVCEGQLKLSTVSREGRTMIVKLAVAGDILGLSAVLNTLAHEVTAKLWNLHC
jgi:CRP/FNR family cyclic AMP-dependent transcriptional regulator